MAGTDAFEGRGCARILTIAVLTWVVAFARLSQIIAGSTEAAHGALIGGAKLGDCSIAFITPTLLGNAIGGASSLALLDHAPASDQAMSGKEADDGSA